MTDAVAVEYTWNTIRWWSLEAEIPVFSPMINLPRGGLNVP